MIVHPAVTVFEAGVERVAELAELNRQLRDDEGYPDPMTDPKMAATVHCPMCRFHGLPCHGVTVVTHAQFVERMTNWLHAGYRSYLACEDGHTVGYCLFQETAKYYYQLRHFFVVRERRRRGIGTALLDWMYAHVWSSKPVLLEVFSHNAPAVAFYRAYGFRVRTTVLRMEK